jgi:hypothetical protein
VLILTDDGPMVCDNASHTVRDMRTGRPPRTAQQMAREDKRLVAMVRNWASSKRRHAHDSTSRSTQQEKTMRSRFNAAALFQRPERRDGEAFADYIAETKMRPLDLWRKKLRDASLRVSCHAFDSAPDHEEALKHLQRMEDHIEARGGTPDFDPAYLGQCFTAMMKSLGTEEDDEVEDSDPDHVTDPNNHGGPPTVRAKDRGENPDHRKDFNDIEQGGADDSALAFDADALFQRGER